MASGSSCCDPSPFARRLADVSPTAAALRQASRSMDHLLTVRLERVGISFHHARALFSVEHLDARTVGGLATVMDLSNSVTRLVDALEREGWLRRERSARDRRVVGISVTEAGRRIVERAMTIAAEAWRDALASLPDGERADLARGLQ